MGSQRVRHNLATEQQQMDMNFTKENHCSILVWGLPWWLSGKEPACRQVKSLGREDPPEKEMTMHSSILDWEIPWTESDGQQFMGWQESDTT